MAKAKPKKKRKYVYKKKTGRPSKYKPRFCKELVKFCDKPIYEERELPHYGPDGQVKWNDVKRFPASLPTLVGFAKHIEVGLSTLYDWMNPKHASYQKKFSETVTRIFKDLQKDFLIQGALQGFYNPAFAIFTAKNITDMKDKQEVEQGGEVTLRVVYEDSPVSGDNNDA